MRRKVVFAIFVFFLFGAGIVISSKDIDKNKTKNVIIETGNLYGYVNDTNSNPIEGALVRVYFHGVYEEDYTDSNGFYHVSNIPLCWCMKDAVASKIGYLPDIVTLVIHEHTYYDFNLTSIGSIPHLDCHGDISWTEVSPGEKVFGSISIENIGDTGSELNWEIESWPEWGNWSFDPFYRIGQTPEQGEIRVDVEVKAPNDSISEYSGEVKIVNIDNTEDFCIVEISLIIASNVKIIHLKDIYPYFLVQKKISNLPFIYQIILDLFSQQKNFFQNKEYEKQNIIVHEGINGYVK